MFSITRPFFDLLYGETPADFESAFDLHESIKRLSEVSQPTTLFGVVTRQAAVGEVTKRGVSLQMMIPFFRNSFKPFYVGQFQVIDGRVVLTGCFTMHWSVKAFMTMWFGFCALWIAGSVTVAAVDPSAWLLPCAGMAMFVAGCAIVAFGKKLSAGDATWLTTLIQQALAEENAHTALLIKQKSNH
jgi:hypothetical protein